MRDKHRRKNITNRKHLFETKNEYTGSLFFESRGDLDFISDYSAADGPIYDVKIKYVFSDFLGLNAICELSI